MPVTEVGRVPVLFSTIQTASNSAHWLVTGPELRHRHPTRVRLALRKAEVLNGLPMAHLRCHFKETETSVRRRFMDSRCRN